MQTHQRHVLLSAETAEQYEARIAVLHSQQAELRKSGGQNTVGAKLFPPVFVKTLNGSRLTLPALLAQWKETEDGPRGCLRRW